MQADPLLQRLTGNQLEEERVARCERDATILRLWRGKFNTAEIAAYLRVAERVVANRLAQLRDAGAR